jgi:hypothetical protein
MCRSVGCSDSNIRGIITVKAYRTYGDDGRQLLIAKGSLLPLLSVTQQVTGRTNTVTASHTAGAHCILRREGGNLPV